MILPFSLRIQKLKSVPFEGKVRQAARETTRPYAILQSILTKLDLKLNPPIYSHTPDLTLTPYQEYGFHHYFQDQDGLNETEHQITTIGIAIDIGTNRVYNIPFWAPVERTGNRNF